MGLDVNLFAVGQVSDSELDEANDFVRWRTFGFWDDYHKVGTPLIRSRPGQIEFQTLMRYYGPGYERGSWPEIRGAIIALRAALPNAIVYYGNDCDEYPLEADDNLIAEYDAHWVSPAGDAYRL